MASPLRLRLLQDIAEMQTKPYPNIELHIQDEDISTGCLILTVEGYGAMHLTITFPSDYPLVPPVIRMDSKVTHPNIKEAGHICASILDTEMDYTPAYTLKGIAIQLLSFFSSDRIQQIGGDFFFTLEDFRNLHVQENAYTPPYQCDKCSFGTQNGSLESDDPASLATAGAQLEQQKTALNHVTPAAPRASAIQTVQLPDEMFLSIFRYLESEDLLAFAEAWPRIAVLIARFNVIRTRELQCFTLKKDYMTSTLGIGVAVVKENEKGNQMLIVSEFDILSEDAFNLGVRRSVQGIPFKYWLPLPISETHWKRLRGGVDDAFNEIAHGAGLGGADPVHIIFKFLNDIIVKLNKETEETTYRSPIYPYEEKAKSTLEHASEKAIESYFHIFHLLLCKATEEDWILKESNELVDGFMHGKGSRDYIPNIGHLLIHTLISDIPVSQDMIQKLIIEAVLRNVKGVLLKHPELAYLEPTPVSEYRLQKTFEASKTSYRILMFLNLFRRIAIGTPRRTVKQLRDNAFERHGAPAPGGAEALAVIIKEIHLVKNFNEFLISMGIPTAGKGKDWWCTFLKERMKMAWRIGYCGTPLNQGQAMSLRREKEPNIAVQPGVFFLPPPKPGKNGQYNFHVRPGGRR